MFRAKVVEKIKTHILYSITLFFPENHAFYEIMGGKYGRTGQATDGNIIRRMRIAFLLAEATNTLSEYVILIAFPLQQWLPERTSILYLLCLYGLDLQERILLFA
jgi:hypothetical protein